MARLRWRGNEIGFYLAAQNRLRGQMRLGRNFMNLLYFEYLKERASAGSRPVS